MSELRRDPVTGRWVIVAPERSRGRPLVRPTPVAAMDSDMCPFCEGQEAIAGRELLAWRPSGSPANGPGWHLRVVANREPALRVESALGEPDDSLFESLGGLGAHEVVIESEDHRATFAAMSADAIKQVLWAWRERMRDLRRDIRLKSFLIVKNVGAAAGATLDHPHSQLLALPLVPQQVHLELAGAGAYYTRTNRCVFCDVIVREDDLETRVVSSDEATMAFTPFASRVPFELCVTSRNHEAAFEEASDETLAAVAARLRDAMRRLHITLASPPYTLLLHTLPVGEEGAASYHWHIEVLPRLTPVSGVAWDGGVHLNSVSPEEAAEALRRADVSAVAAG